MAKAKPKGKLRGAQLMKANGKKLVAVWLDWNEYTLIDSACVALGLKLAAYLREAAVREATIWNRVRR